MVENIYTKEYFELFVKNLLEMTLPHIFFGLKKGEKPDLYQGNTYGIEVTRVGYFKDLEAMGIWNANAGKKKREISTKNLRVLDRLNPKYNDSDELISINPPEEWRRGEVDVLSAIQKKVERLNSADFNSGFQYNCLFLRYEACSNQHTTEQIISIFNSVQIIAPKKFDVLFIWDMIRLHSYYNSDIVSLDLLRDVKEKAIEDQKRLKNPK